jgi:hypothetical protein
MSGTARKILYPASISNAFRENGLPQPTSPMSKHITTKNFMYDHAPRRIRLLGDKTIRPEPATHIIEFPGGAIELSRTTEGNYWAHIIINRDFALPEDCEGLRAAYGEIVESRIDYDFPADPHIVNVPNANQVRQIAILIEPRLGQVSAASPSILNPPLPFMDEAAK